MYRLRCTKAETRQMGSSHGISCTAPGHWEELQAQVHDARFDRREGHGKKFRSGFRASAYFLKAHERNSFEDRIPPWLILQISDLCDQHQGLEPSEVKIEERISKWSRIRKSVISLDVLLRRKIPGVFVFLPGIAKLPWSKVDFTCLANFHTNSLE